MTIRSDRIALMELFLLIMQKRNVSAAAEGLFISPATASRHLKNLELQLGVSLFDRNTHKIFPTSEAYILFPHAQEIIDTWDSIARISVASAAR